MRPESVDDRVLNDACLSMMNVPRIDDARLLVEDSVGPRDLAVRPVVAEQLEGVALALGEDAQRELRVAGDGERHGVVVVEGRDAVAESRRARRCRSR